MFCSSKLCIYFQWHSYNLQRYFSTSKATFKVIPKNLKKFSKSSQDWLTRHLNDPYVKKANYEHYRARSAFKLLEIDEKHKLLGPGKIVVDCGASPGSWTQVVVSKLKDKDGNQNGKVISVDINYFEKVDGAIMLPGHDFNADSTQSLIEKELGGKKVHLILSDMAPKASGNKDIDHTLIMELASSAFRFALKNARYGSDFLCKLYYRLLAFYIGGRLLLTLEDTFLYWRKTVLKSLNVGGHLLILEVIQYWRKTLLNSINVELQSIILSILE